MRLKRKTKRDHIDGGWTPRVTKRDFPEANDTNLYPFAIAAVTSYHKCSDLAQYKLFYSNFTKLKSRCQQNGDTSGGFFAVTRF
jgi:hypothetical protein